MAIRSERVLVTGARGFTGRHLCARLEADGFHVVGLVEAAPSANEVQGNLLDRDTIDAAVEAAAPDRVVHLAAISSVEHGHAEELYRTNLLGTLGLLESLAGRGLGRGGIVLASSARIYGDLETGAMDENAALSPAGHYAVSKLAMESMASLYRVRLPITVVRPFNYTGPGQPEPFLVPKIVRHFAERAKSIELGNIEVVRDILDVRTVVEAYRRLLVCPAAAGQAFNVCSGVGATIADIIAHLERLTGHRIDIRIDPALVRPNEPQRLVGSMAKLAAIVGKLPTIPLATTLAEMLDTYADSARNVVRTPARPR